MSVKGVKVDNKELQKFIDRLTYKVITDVSKAGKEALKETMISHIRQWYAKVGCVSSGQSIIDNLYFDIGRTASGKMQVIQRGNKATVYIYGYIDSNGYDQTTRAKKYRIYDWATAHGLSKIEAQYQYMADEDSDWKEYQNTYSISSYLFMLPWKYGISGLPQYSKTHEWWTNRHFHQIAPTLGVYVKRGVHTNFKKTFNKYYK